VAEKQTFLYQSAQYNHIMANGIHFRFFLFHAPLIFCMRE